MLDAECVTGGCTFLWLRSAMSVATTVVGDMTVKMSLVQGLLRGCSVRWKSANTCYEEKTMLNDQYRYWV